MSSHKPYPEYVDSGVEWLGDIPSHWDANRLGNFFEERREKVSDTEYPALSVTMKGIVPQLENAAKTDAGDNRKLVRKTDFVINSRSDRKGSSGVSALDGSVSLISIVLQTTRIEPSYTHHLLRSYAFQEEFYRYGKGIVADLWSTNSSEMKNILIPDVPRAEQAAIANFLDHETAKIDTLIEKQQQLIKLLKEKRQAVISHAVTKGLNPDAPMKDSGVEWLGEVPAGWVISRAKYVSNIRYGIGEPPKYVQEGVALVRATNIRSGKISPIGLVYVDPSDIPQNRIVWLAAGDIVVVRSGATTGDSSIIPKEYEQSIAGFDMVVRASKCNSAFLGYALLSDYLRRNQIDQEKMRAAQPHLNAEELGACIVLIPTLAEQEMITSFLDRNCVNSDRLLRKAQHAQNLLQERRTALISAAVTGKIDVRNWQPPESTSTPSMDA